MSLEVFDCEQGSDEWTRLRLGLPTASNFRSIMAESEDRKMRSAYMRVKAAEIITGQPVKGYRNAHMDRGHAMEPEARAAYMLTRDVEVTRVGIGIDRDIGAAASPDGLVGDEGMVEFKSVEADAMVELIDANKVFSTEHFAQCQGGLLIMARYFCDLVVYAPKMPLYVRRTYRDVAYITRLRAEIKKFNADVAEMVERIRGAK